MFSIWKKGQPLLKDLVPDDYTDIHSHLLWGIDDGAPTEAVTKVLVSQIKALGFARCITTPHVMTAIWENTTAGITSKALEVAHAQEHWEERIPIKAAAEYLLDLTFISKLETDELLPLHDRLLLVELSYSNPPVPLYELLFAIQLKGYTPVLAHPERYLYYKNDLASLFKMKDVGCLFQLNLPSTVGYYGKAVAELSDTLLRNGLYDFVGSDIHHENHVRSFSNKIVIKHTKLLETCFAKNSYLRF